MAKAVHEVLMDSELAKQDSVRDRLLAVQHNVESLR